MAAGLKQPAQHIQLRRPSPATTTAFLVGHEAISRFRSYQVCHTPPKHKSYCRTPPIAPSSPGPRYTRYTFVEDSVMHLLWMKKSRGIAKENNKRTSAPQQGAFRRTRVLFQPKARSLSCEDRDAGTGCAGLAHSRQMVPRPGTRRADRARAPRRTGSRCRSRGSPADSRATAQAPASA